MNARNVPFDSSCRICGRVHSGSHRTLTQWSRDWPSAVVKHSKGAFVTPDVYGSQELRSEAYRLRDYIVSSSVAGAIWFVQRFAANPPAPTCENGCAIGMDRAQRIAAGLTSDGRALCESCLRSEFEYAEGNVPEALDGMTEAEYVTECAARLAEPRW